MKFIKFCALRKKSLAIASKLLVGGSLRRWHSQGHSAGYPSYPPKKKKERNIGTVQSVIFTASWYLEIMPFFLLTHFSVHKERWTYYPVDFSVVAVSVYTVRSPSQSSSATFIPYLGTINRCRNRAYIMTDVFLNIWYNNEGLILMTSEYSKFNPNNSSLLPMFSCIRSIKCNGCVESKILTGLCTRIP